MVKAAAPDMLGPSLMPTESITSFVGSSKYTALFFTEKEIQPFLS